MSLSNIFKVNVKVMETSMSKYAMHGYHHAQFECYSLNIVWDNINIKYYRSSTR